MSVGYVYPFRCEVCQHRFKALRWGERYVRAQPDRRRHERLPVDFWTTLFWKDGERQGRVRDLSEAGATLEADLPVAPGESLELTLQPNDSEPPITVEVAVVRSVQSGRLGLQFIRVKGGDDERLGKFLRERGGRRWTR
ncbi:MAG: PilZ domain-containing protein [Candidatus Rokubacteria bacterium]|nr:PilZ domain-containing protein [Candidatus Rokubacteria bacterium]